MTEKVDFLGFKFLAKIIYHQWFTFDEKME